MTPEQTRGFAQFERLWGEENLTPLTIPQLKRHKKVADEIGWQIQAPVDYLGEYRTLCIALPGAFPCEEPKVWVEPSAYLDWPHCERDGTLCLWPPDTKPVWMNSEALIDATLEQLSQLLLLVRPASTEAQRTQHFADEWTSYWRIPTRIGDMAEDQLLLLSNNPPSNSNLCTALATLPTESSKRKLNRTYILAGSSKTEVDQWLKNSGAEIHEQSNSAIAIGLHTQPSEPGTPGTWAQLVAYIDRWAIDPAVAHAQLQTLTVEKVDADRWIVIYHDSASVALRIRPVFKKQHRAGYKSPKERRNQEEDLAFERYQLTPALTQRIDGPWVHGRGVEMEASALLEKKVLLIGCGSLGSMIAESCCLSAIGTLTIVDPAVLETTNVGRHALGMGSVGLSKAEMMATRCSSDYPHLTIRHFQCSAMSTDSSLRTALAEADLVVSTTADPGVEGYILNTLDANRIQRVLLSWVEPHALAGHAVQSNDAIQLRSLFDNGKFKKRVVSWSKDQRIDLPGCGESHIPGAGNRIRLIASVIVEHIIATLTQPTTPVTASWMADQRLITALGGVVANPVQP